MKIISFLKKIGAITTPDEIIETYYQLKQAKIEKEKVIHQERLEKIEEIITRDEKMQKLKKTITQVANSEAPVLITGETGTGKALVAQAIHYGSPRCKNLLVRVNCAALPEEILQSELFGHERGFFAGGHKKKGRLEFADRGTLFLDEIDDISPTVQTKLLRLLQEGALERMGGEKTFRVNVRIIASTNHDLSQAIKQQRFREDLFYRLSPVSINLPPLRKRKQDIPLLAEYFLRKHRKYREAKKQIEGISKEALDLLVSYEWPGNIRELENAIERAVILAKGPLLEKQDFPLSIQDLAATEKTFPSPSRALREIEVYLLSGRIKKDNLMSKT